MIFILPVYAESVLIVLTYSKRNYLVKRFVDIVIRELGDALSRPEPSECLNTVIPSHLLFAPLITSPLLPPCPLHTLLINPNLLILVDKISMMYLCHLKWKILYLLEFMHDTIYPYLYNLFESLIDAW